MHPKKVLLKKHRDKAIRNLHHWIFSGAVQSFPDFSPGDLLPVYSNDSDFLGTAYFNPSCSIVGRMLSFSKQSALDALQKNMEQAVLLRKTLFSQTSNNAYRVINAEGDGIPGLIVDKYAHVLVLQISTLGMEKLKGFIVEQLLKLFPNCSMIYEKSNLPSRKEEGLSNHEELLYGEKIQEVEIIENDIRFIVSFEQAQKTGFFLDQREMRQSIRNLSQGRKVLNCFSYSGGFSLYASLGGAVRIDSVDQSSKAIALAQRNFSLNQIDPSSHGFFATDAFHFLKTQPLDYSLVILDPPAFAKKKADIHNACRGYKEINRLAFQKMPKNSFLLTCSCSYYIDEKLFQTVIFQAAQESARPVKVLSFHKQAQDHPVNIYHPESKYLKSLLLYL